MGATPRELDVVRCRGCGLVSLSPRPGPDELAAFYPEDYEPFWAPVDEEQSGLRRWLHVRHFALRCRVIRRGRPTGGRALDVGCGTGGFLRELCRDGTWQGMGVDRSERALAVARRQAVEVRLGELADLRLPAASFDAVTMWDVIEHLPDPRGVLVEIRRLLKPQGRLLLSTPNATSWQARIWREHWAGWDVPRHLQVFCFATLDRLLEDTGFAIVRRFRLPHERFYAVESAHRWLAGAGSHPAQENGTVRAAAAELVRLLSVAAWPGLRVADLATSASCLCLEASANAP